jgi:hypothetical protein
MRSIVSRNCSCCGVICETDCKAYGTECKGCLELSGKIPWAVFYGTGTCPIYSCVQEMKFSSCAECDKAPCSVWFATRNPDISDEEFMADINNRLRNLSNI